jgi:hypothetical protein
MVEEVDSDARGSSTELPASGWNTLYEPSRFGPTEGG